MSAKEWYTNVRIQDRNGTWRTITPHYVRVRQPITDESFYAEYRWVDNGKLDNTIYPDTSYIGCTTEVYAGVRTIPNSDINMNLIFRGRVSKIGQEYTGRFKDKAERFVNAYGFGKMLQVNELSTEVPSGDDVEQFEYAASLALKEGLISGYSIYPYVVVSDLRKREGKRSYWEVLRDIAQDADWDFYVDNGNTLRAFPRGIYVYDKTIEPDFRARIEYDDSRIVNTVEVEGRGSKVIGSDSDYTEDINYWSGSNIELSTERKVGNYSVRASETGASPIAVLSFPGGKDLSKGGALHFYLAVEVIEPTDLNPGECSIRIRAYSGSDYFEKIYGVSGGSNAQVRAKFYRMDWKEQFVAYNYYDTEGWSENGKPTWSNISNISFELLYPVGGVTSFYIDDFYLANISVHGFASDSNSIAKYGVRKGPTLRDTNILTDAQAQVIAESLVNVYKEPMKFIENVEVEDTFNLPLGYQATIALFGDNIPVTVRELEYEFEGKELRERANFAERYVPKIEHLLRDAVSILRKVNYNVELFRKIFGDMAAIDTASGLIDFDRVSEYFPYLAWTGINKLQLTGEGQSGYECSNWDYFDLSVGQVVFRSSQLLDHEEWLRTKKKLSTANSNVFWKTQAQFYRSVSAPIAGYFGIYSDSPERGCYFWVDAYGDGTLWFRYYDGYNAKDVLLVDGIAWEAWYLLEFRYYHENKQIEIFLNEVPKETIQATLDVDMYPFRLWTYTWAETETLQVTLVNPVIGLEWKYSA